ncbi:hypothetical protein DFH07DRAFT_776919 [Mycena maculata]|uniref:CxC2-like cysteine cluster KDZ transposase-associated domain-containing protein n=1 Tax=Mycena maculata TaxID=230809 RepID=A0AAD7N5A2_9AGAR|nr:hypothetical protein DFH07DRAFT_776919 [Mycena maculata]
MSSSAGVVTKKRKTLTSEQVRAQQLEEARLEAKRLEVNSYEQLRRDVPEYFDDSHDDYLEDVLHGRTAANLSNAGEELTQEDVATANSDFYEQLRESQRQRLGKYVDSHTRKNRTQEQVDVFAKQIPSMADAFLKYSVEARDAGLAYLYKLPEDAVIEETREVLVVDVFTASYEPFPLIVRDEFVSSACICQGWIPVSAYYPTVVITIRALEVFRVANLRCPRLGIQAFTRMLCDLHDVEKCAQVALGCDGPNWCLKNACPACLYKLEDEAALPIALLTTTDGNNSLSRFQLREREEVREDGSAVLGASRQRPDNRIVPGDYYISREEVNKWGEDSLEELMRDFTASADDDEEDGSCEERWQNMKEDVMAHAWGMFNETGIFPALCRHGFVLVVVDMVKSGELTKYGFTVTAHLLRVLGEHGNGYNIGCEYAKRCKSHPVLSKLAAENNFKSLVGSFHGHGHNRRCQMRNLTTYVKGVGLESLEGCEAYFSKSNALAATTRHASRFHRQQAIVNYMKHTDKFDTYQGLSLVLCSKYRRALEIKGTYGSLCDAMQRLQVESHETYLRTLSREPLEETLEMEYYQKLVNLQATEAHVLDVCGVVAPFMPAEGEASYRRHAQEMRDKALGAVHDLELRIPIDTRWIEGGEKWEATARMAHRRRYQRALDHLEGLVVAHMFELAKCHMSGTGYKLRKHIAKALQARSKAIKAAIVRYNDATEAMEPPMPTLNWEEVVECAFLADFDLLREGRQDIRQEPWALPAGRAAMDQHFKLLRADEEIQRLNVEIHRFVTYMVDEEAFPAWEEGCLRTEGNEGITQQVRLLWMERGRFTSLHMKRLVKLSKLPSFTGSILSGVSVSKERYTPVVRDVEMVAPPPAEVVRPVGVELPALDEEEGEDDDNEEGVNALTALIQIVQISGDGGAIIEDR